MVASTTAIVGRIKGRAVKYDGINYYVTIHGRNYAIEYANKRDQREGSYKNEQKKC